MQITEDMVTIFNSMLENLNCSFRLRFENEMSGNAAYHIVPANDMFIHSSIINLTDEFYKVLEDFFYKRGIELSYNNTKSTFWSKNGWEKL